MQNLEIELDAKVIVDLIQSRIYLNAFYSSLLADCRSLLGRFPHSKLQHVYQEANKCANALATRGCAMQDDYVVFDSSPFDDISSLVYFDVNGESFCRLTTTNLAILASPFNEYSI